MIHQFGADLLYLLNILNDMGYMILFVVVMIEDASFRLSRARLCRSRSA
jgi:hypothetical protein